MGQPCSTVGFWRGLFRRTRQRSLHASRRPSVRPRSSCPVRIPARRQLSLCRLSTEHDAFQSRAVMMRGSPMLAPRCRFDSWCCRLMNSSSDIDAARPPPRDGPRSPGCPEHFDLAVFKREVRRSSSLMGCTPSQSIIVTATLQSTCSMDASEDQLGSTDPAIDCCRT